MASFPSRRFKMLELNCMSMSVHVILVLLSGGAAPLIFFLEIYMLIRGEQVQNATRGDLFQNRHLSNIEVTSTSISAQWLHGYVGI